MDSTYLCGVGSIVQCTLVGGGEFGVCVCVCVCVCVRV